MAAITVPSRVPSAAVRHRRRQVVIAILVLGVVWTLWGVVGRLGSGPLTAPGPDPARALPAASQVYVVQPGDTVWRIARELQPTGEIRPLVDRLSAQLHGRPLEAGQQLTLSGGGQ